MKIKKRDCQNLCHLILVRIILLALFISIVMVTMMGCKVTTFSYTTPGGAQVRATDTRLFLSTSASASYRADTTNGVSLQIGVKSDPHADAIRAAAEGAAAGARK
jgi:hypothetical protein